MKDEPFPCFECSTGTCHDQGTAFEEVSQVSKHTDTCDTKKNLGRKPRKPQKQTSKIQ
jgi:hypothetical protein